jgi:hypothetical protein
LTGFRIDGSDVASLPGVAPEAGISEVLNLGASAVLPADDVVYLMGKVSVVLMQQAVFAAVSGAFCDEVSNSLPISLAKPNPLPGAGLGHHHNVLELKAILQLGTLLR